MILQFLRSAEFFGSTRTAAVVLARYKGICRLANEPKCSVWSNIKFHQTRTILFRAGIAV